MLHRTEDAFETAKVSRLVMLQCMWSGFLPHSSLLALHGLLLSPKYPLPLAHCFTSGHKLPPALTGIPADSHYSIILL